MAPGEYVDTLPEEWGPILTTIHPPVQAVLVADEVVQAISEDENEAGMQGMMTNVVAMDASDEVITGVAAAEETRTRAHVELRMRDTLNSRSGTLRETKI